jgi:hypothetical protein
MNKIAEDDKSGHLYCLYNKMYQTYGNNIYKLGHTCNPAKRINDYMTSYIEESEYKYVSERRFENSLKAERILFFLLRRNRVKKNREFFSLQVDDIIDTIKRVEAIPFEKIEKIYKIILNEYCSDRVFERIEDNVHYLDCLVSPDIFFEQFKFRPKNPELYRKFGYIADRDQDWYILQGKLYNNEHNDQSDEEDNRQTEG